MLAPAVAERLGDQVLVANGTIGTRTPARRPISAANIPPALTMTSASILPYCVSTARTRPRSTSIPETRVCVKTRVPPARAPSISAVVSSDGSR